MIESIRKMWKIPELRRKIVYTFLMLLLFRLVSVVPAPGVDVAAVKNLIAQGTASSGSVLVLFWLITFATSTPGAGITPTRRKSTSMRKV